MENHEVIKTTLVSILLNLFFCHSEIPPKTNKEKSIVVKLHPINPDSLKYIENIPYWPKKNPPSFIEQSKKSVRVGSLRISSNSCQIGIINFRTKKYSMSSILWIDINRNGKYDYYEDLLESMLLPFTLRLSSYKVVKVHPSGKFIEIKKYKSEKIPPISIGLPAPDFAAPTIDSTYFQLSKLKGKNIFLYFWTCNPNNHLVPVSKAASKLQGKDIEVICVGSKMSIDNNGKIFYKKLLPECKNIKINWTHVFHEGMNDKNRDLYQVGSLMKSFIIDKKGIIRSVDKPLSAEEIVGVIEEYLEFK